MRTSDHVVRSLSNKDFSWHKFGACISAPADIFFMEEGSLTQNRTRAKQAKEICSGCPVRMKCLQQALDNGEPSYIWGGKTSDERRAILRRQRRGY